MSELVSAQARAWIGREAPPQRIEITRNEIRKYAIATEQRAEKYLNGDEAPPMFLFAALRPIVPMDDLRPDGIYPDSFVPELPLKRVMAGGIKMHFNRPLKPGDVLIARRYLKDIVEKQGASGPLIFLIYGLKVETEDGDMVVEQEQVRINR